MRRRGSHHPGERTRALSPWADGVGLPRHTTSEWIIFNICSIFRQEFNENKFTPSPLGEGAGGEVGANMRKPRQAHPSLLSFISKHSGLTILASQNGSSLPL